MQRPQRPYPLPLHEIENVATPFTQTYSQPAEYHFCQDSVLFPRHVARRVKSGRSQKTNEKFRVLDVCAGCGVVGLELSHHLRWIEEMDFIEIQSSFKTHFNENLKYAERSTNKFRFLNHSFNRLLEPEFRERYDLVISAPPYFESHEGVLPDNSMKNRCRFFMDGPFETLLRGIAHAMKPEGRGYMLMKSGAKHGRDQLLRARLALAGVAQIKPIAGMRGTVIVEISRVN